MMTDRIYVVVTIILCLLSACVSVKPVVKAEHEQQSSIVFVTFNIQRDSATGKSTVKVLNKEKVEGSVKKSQQNLNGSGYILSFGLYSHGKLADTMAIDHPLFKHLETVNHDNVLGIKDTLLKQEDFFLRMQIKGSSNELRMYEILRGQQAVQLETIKL